MRRNPAFYAICVGGIVAGVSDITYAILFWQLRNGVPAARVLQSVASGVLGAAATKGGWPAAALGLGLHFFIAFAFAAFFYFVSRRVPVLVRHAAVAGVLYGAGIFALMNLVVVPMSAFPRKLTFPPSVLITGLLIHMFGIGLPIALACRRAARLQGEP